MPASEPLRVDPAKLQKEARRATDHARAFRSAHEASEVLAQEAQLGGGAAGAALAPMLQAWQTSKEAFGQLADDFAAAKRAAADRYTATDGDAGATIGDAGL